jgi:hypothetical protein
LLSWLSRPGFDEVEVGAMGAHAIRAHKGARPRVATRLRILFRRASAEIANRTSDRESSRIVANRRVVVGI